MKHIFLLLACVFLLSQNLFSQDEEVFCGLDYEDQGLQKTASVSSIPNTGTFRNLVVLCKFSDDNFDKSPNTDLWPHTLNSMPSWGPNLVSNAVQTSYSNPSISGYFDVMSDDNYDVIGDVVFYQPAHNQSYYFISSGRHIGYLTEEILNAVNLIVNYDDYDNNSDGKVDMIQICFRFANTYELDMKSYDSNPNDNNKPHYQGIAGLTGYKGTFASGTSLTLDGKTISAATLNGSGTFCSGVTDLHSALPVMAHELGHYLFGGVHYVGVGFHGLMDGNGSGVMSSFERIKMGWITPTLVTTNKTNEAITDALTTNDIYKIIAPNGSYFLIDNHQRQNFYESTWTQYNGGPLVSPGTGVLVSHCTSSSVDIESAFGRWGWKKSGGLYVFPFETDVPNRNFGEDKLDIRRKNTTQGSGKNHPDFLGSAEDFFNLSYNHILSPWSNPSTSYNSNNNSNISIVLRQNISGVIYADFYINDITITENTSFPSETFEFNGNLIVNSGVTLTIQPNTILKFASGKSLTVNGTLNVQGTSSNPVTFDFISPDATAKNGIKLDGSGSLSISHAIVKNAYNGISITTPVSGSPSIENTEIKNCYNGIVIQYGNKDADITIADNNIYDNTNYGISISNPDHFGMNFEPSTSDNIITNCNYGIYLNEANVDISGSEFSDCIYGLYLYRTNYAGGQPTITDVHSHDNSTSGIALYYSSPKILDSEFDDNHYGINCSNYSSAELGYAGTYGNNNIHNNFYGLYAFSNSNPFLGRQTCIIQGGNNKIAYNGPYNARVLSSSTVIAEQNYWGANPPQSSLIYADGTSSIDYTPWLVSSPFKLVPNRSKSPEEYVFNKSFDNSASSVDTSKPSSFDPKWPLFWKILYARNLVDVGKYKFAQEICKDIINEYPDSSLSFYALDLLWKASQKDDEDSFKSYLTTIKNKRIIKNLYGSAEIILSGYENTGRISSLDNLVNQYSSRSVEEAALFSKFLYYINEQKNIEMARAVSKELDDKFPDSPAAIDAHMQLGDKVKDIIISKSGNVEKLLIEDNMPKEYTLLGNYPNPFNPSTKIRYVLPFDSDVEVIIYNINGELVKAFKYGSQSAGLYDVKWNGTNSNNEQVSSGIYLYHFKAISLQKNNEVFEKSAKLILMK